MPVTSPNTIAVTNAIQTIAQALTITPIGTISGYNTVSIGAEKDVTDILPLLEITGADDETERDSMAAVGNTVEINDEQWFQLMTTVDYTDSETAEQVVFALRDALTNALHTTAKLGGGVPGVIGVYVEKPGKYGYTFRNGIQYRIHQIRIRVTYWYEPTMGA
jgi:hypothetical protein